MTGVFHDRRPQHCISCVMMVKSDTVFYIGATGYIGGVVLQHLLLLPHPPSRITALIRDPKKVELLKNVNLPSGVTLEPLLGSLQDLETLTKAAEEHDVVFSMADADDLPAMKAILEGIKRRKEKTGEVPLLIHTSGTGLLTDNAKGSFAGETVSSECLRAWLSTDLYRPGTETSDRNLPSSAFHRGAPGHGHTP